MLAAFQIQSPLMSIVKTENLHKKYPVPGKKNDFFFAVNGTSLAIEAGEIYGILGPNGAGKTTTLEMIEGLTDIDEGEAWVDNISVTKKPYRVKKIIGVQLQANEYFDHLNLAELIKLFSQLYGRHDNPLDLLAHVNLQEKAHAKPKELSGGQQQRFSIACALVHEPKVLFLDEPTTGLDPQAKRNIWELVKNLNARGMTIVLTTHNRRLCTAIWKTFFWR
jgi:ABC-2 type transport system ATP-binding protein